MHSPGKEADLRTAAALVKQLARRQVRMQAGIQCDMRPMP